MSFGWYYDGCTVQDEDADVWELIGRAVETAADDERMHALLVGEMHDCEAGELFDEQDVISMSDDGRLSADEILEVISERHGERVYDGIATMDDAAAKPALRRIIQAHRCAEDAAPSIVAWVRKYIALDPHIACMGRKPLPIEHMLGEWHWGSCSEYEPDAVITYAAEPSPETGHVGWVWWARGKMGDAPTLADAMRAAEAVLA